MTVKRRHLLMTMLASLALPGTTLAFGDGSKVGVAELDLGGGTLSRPNAWKRLLYDVRHTTSVETNAQVERITPGDVRLFEFPFAVLVGDAAFPMPSESDLGQLKRFLDYGGVLFIDDVTGTKNSAFDNSVRRLVSALFPNRPLAPLPANHSLFRAFFLIQGPRGRLNNFPYIEGVSVGNLSPILYGRNDLSGALDRDKSGRQRPCVPGGETQRREAIKLAMNLILYTITTNYKLDQAHVAELMRQNRLPGTFSE